MMINRINKLSQDYTPHPLTQGKKVIFSLYLQKVFRLLFCGVLLTISVLTIFPVAFIDRWSALAVSH